MPNQRPPMNRRTVLGASTAALPVFSRAGWAAAAQSDAVSVSPRFRRGFTASPYGQTHYRYVINEASAKTPLICLHPSPLSGIVYENWLVEMGRDRDAFAPDTPGYGVSDAPSEPAGIHAFAEAMIAFMDELGVERADVMGYHTGSFTSVDLARTFPDRIRKVVLISAPIFDAEELAAYRKGVAGPEPTFDEMLERTLANWRKNGRGMFRDVTDDRYVEFRLESIRRFRTSPWGFRAAFDYDLAEGLSQTEQPVLVLNPEDDLWEQTPRAKPYLNAESRIHDLPGWTHGHLDAHTAEMAQIVREFLDS